MRSLAWIERGMQGSTEVFDAQGLQRAVLYRQGAYPGLRTALWIALAPGLPGDHRLHGFAGLWLIAPLAGPLACMASRHAPTGRSVGGQVVRALPLLDPCHPHIQALAGTLAAQRGRQALQRAELTALEQALQAFCAGLEAEALRASRIEGEASVEVYNHYCIGDARRARNRVQAAVSHPAFAEALRAQWPLRRAVDQGAPLTAQLAERYGVRPATIKRARSASLAGDTPLTPGLLRTLDRLDLATWPETAADWAVLARLGDGLLSLVERAGLARAAVLKPFNDGWAKGLAALEQRLQGPLDPDAILELMHCAYHYGVRPAVAAALAERGRSTAVAQTPPAAFFPLWFAHYGLARLARLARDWQVAHGQLSLQRLAADHPRPVEAVRWPAFVAAGATHGAWRVVELTSQTALELEGQRLDHCVASYTVKCLLAESALFSLRDTAGVPRSTFEARVPVAGEAMLLQHHGPDNAPPSAGERQVAQRFVARVLNAVPSARRRAVQQARHALGERVRARLDEPDTAPAPLDAASAAALSDAIAIAHPAPARRQGLMAYLETQGRAVLSAMGVAAC